MGEFEQACVLYLLQIVGVTICFSGTMYILEALGDIPGLADYFVETPQGDEISFLQMCYFTFTTISTVSSVSRKSGHRS